MASTVTPAKAYPTCEQVMNRARAFVNDAFRGGAGRILTDQAPFTIEYLNSALEEIQDDLGNSAVITFLRDNTILSPITPVAVNPATQIFISYEGFFNGTVMVPLPALPSGCISVLRLWERQTGSNQPWQPMTQPKDGLPGVYQGQWLCYWEYRGDRIYLIGSTTTEDLRMRWEERYAPLSDPTTFATTSIKILASVNALAKIVAYNYALARGAAAATMQADAERFKRYIKRRYSRRGQRIGYNRQPYGGGYGTGSQGEGLPGQ